MGYFLQEVEQTEGEDKHKHAEHLMDGTVGYLHPDEPCPKTAAPDPKRVPGDGQRDGGGEDHKSPPPGDLD